jgi:hypothetical protein
MRVVGETSAAGLRLFLATKIVTPRLPEDLIIRPRLVGLTERAASKRLTMIKAPVGSGKTTLAVILLDRMRANGAQAAWLSFDADDNEPARFLNYLAHPLLHACGNVGAAAITPTADAAFAPPHAIVTTVVNELVELDDEVVLFLDAYHVVSLPEVHDVMSFFIERKFPNLGTTLCTPRTCRMGSWSTDRCNLIHSKRGRPRHLDPATPSPCLATNERNASFSTNDPKWRKIESSHGRFISCQKSRIVAQFPCKPPGKLSLTRGVVYAHEALRAGRHHGGRPVKRKQCLLLRRPDSKRIGIRSGKPPTYFCSQRRCRFRAVVGQKVSSTGLRCS